MCKVEEPGKEINISGHEKHDSRLKGEGKIHRTEGNSD